VVTALLGADGESVSSGFITKLIRFRNPVGAGVIEET
jgi:hypothetical protein